MPRRPTIAPDPDRSDLKTLLRYLGLHQAAENYQELLTQAEKGNWSHLRFLERLASQEAAAKKGRSVQARIAQAGFPILKTIDAFDFSFPKAIPHEKVLAALSLQFIERKEGFIFLGEPGTGKTHLAIALGYAACLGGVRVRYAQAVDMITGLQTAAATHRLPEALRAYRQPGLLILDEVGYLPFDLRGADLFFQVINVRHERGSLILTTNQPFKNWGTVFGNTTVATAIVDRLSHHNDLIKIVGDSYRARHRKSREQ